MVLIVGTSAQILADRLRLPAADLSVLSRAGADNAKCLVAATRSDKVNLLVCQVVRAAFGGMRMVARANSTSNLAAFAA